MPRPRKNATAQDTTPVLEDSAQKAEDTISLSFVEAEDALEPEKPNKLKKAFTSVFTTTEEEEKKPRKKKSTFFVKHTYLVVGGLLFCIHLLVPEEYKAVFYVNEQSYQYLPTEEQLSEILTPLARIADRHTQIADINPDILDVLACAQASAAYGMELRATIILKAHIDKKAKEEARMKDQEIWRNRVNGLNA